MFVQEWHSGNDLEKMNVSGSEQLRRNILKTVSPKLNIICKHN